MFKHHITAFDLSNIQNLSLYMYQYLYVKFISRYFVGNQATMPSQVTFIDDNTSTTKNLKQSLLSDDDLQKDSHIASVTGEEIEEEVDFDVIVDSKTGKKISPFPWFTLIVYSVGLSFIFTFTLEMQTFMQYFYTSDFSVSAYTLTVAVAISMSLSFYTSIVLANWANAKDSGKPITRNFLKERARTLTQEFSHGNQDEGIFLRMWNWVRKTWLSFSSISMNIIIHSVLVNFFWLLFFNPPPGPNHEYQDASIWYLITTIFFNVPYHIYLILIQSWLYSYESRSKRVTYFLTAQNACIVIAYAIGGETASKLKSISNKAFSAVGSLSCFVGVGMTVLSIIWLNRVKVKKDEKEIDYLTGLIQKEQSESKGENSIGNHNEITTKIDRYLESKEKSRKRPKIPIVPAIRSSLGNQAFRVILYMMALAGIYFAIFTNMNQWFFLCVYQVDLKTGYDRLADSIITEGVAGVIGILMTSPLVKYLGFIKVVYIGLVLAISGQILGFLSVLILLNSPMRDDPDANERYLGFYATVATGITFIGFGSLQVVLGSLLGMSIDYDELIYSKRRETVYTATYNVIAKIFQTVFGTLFLALLQFLNFQPGDTSAASADDTDDEKLKNEYMPAQPSAVIAYLVFVVGIFPIIIYFSCFFIIRYFPFNLKEHEMIVAENRHRKMGIETPLEEQYLHLQELKNGKKHSAIEDVTEKTLGMEMNHRSASPRNSNSLERMRQSRFASRYTYITDAQHVENLIPPEGLTLTEREMYFFYYFSSEEMKLLQQPGGKFMIRDRYLVDLAFLMLYFIVFLTMTILSAILERHYQVTLFVIITVVESLFASYTFLRHKAILALPSIPQEEIINGAIFQSAQRNIEIVGEGNVDVQSLSYRRKQLLLRLLPHLIIIGILVICSLLLSSEAGVYSFSWHGEVIQA